jgi:hypothetical protein
MKPLMIIVAVLAGIALNEGVQAVASGRAERASDGWLTKQYEYAHANCQKRGTAADMGQYERLIRISDVWVCPDDYLLILPRLQ